MGTDSRSSRNCFLILKVLPARLTFASPRRSIISFESPRANDTWPGSAGAAIVTTARDEGIFDAAWSTAAPPREWPIAPMRSGSTSGMARSTSTLLLPIILIGLPLALLAFLGAGETHRTGHYKETVRKGLRYLKQIQDPEGCFGPRTTNHFTYSTAIATLAMAEAYAMTGSPLFKESAQRGVDFPRRAGAHAIGRSRTGFSRYRSAAAHAQSNG